MTRFRAQKADGSDVRVWGEDKPLHFHYYDEESIFGCDYKGDFGPKRMTQRWSRDKKLLETVCGPVNHSCGSPDRNWFAGENWSRDLPLELYLYKKGDLKPRATIFTSSYIDVVWKNSAHISSSFSHDGTRLYYHRPVSATQMQVFYTDITPLLK